MRLDRINDMEQYVLNHETVSLEELAKQFDVSINTIRRDVNELLERGRIRKVYGGVSAKENIKPLPVNIRASKNRDAKHEIGRMAAELVRDGDTIFLDSGSTVVEMIPHLAKKERITIVTHSLTTMYEASKHPSLQVIALGGLYNHSTSSFVGLSTMQTLSDIYASAVFVAATGVSLSHGLTNTTFFEAEIKRHAVNRSSKVILMADHSKFDYSSTITFYDFSKLYAVVTDRKPSEKYMEVIRNNHIRLFYRGHEE